MLYIKNAAQVATVSGGSQAPKIGIEMEKLNIIENGGVVMDAERIVFVGADEEAAEYVSQHGGEDVNVILAEGKTVTPGLIDPHTHVVFAGSREHELTLRLCGATYMEILQAGGGILNSTI
ncbi:imidazolonepropionase, partial [Paenibacillus sepulcri]|nr:imidazolonepropionase [Paenibacillus sepulcri]